jgi:hypothetical protein
MPDDFFDKVTHWVVVPNGFGGYTFALPTVLDGRWEERTERFLSDAGKETISKAIAYLSADVLTEDYLMLGDTSEADPTNLTDGKTAYQVERFDKIPDVRNLTFERKAYM